MENALRGLAKEKEVKPSAEPLLSFAGTLHLKILGFEVVSLTRGRVEM